GQVTNVPRFLIRNQVGTLLATPGGIITSGPLKGTAFNPDGTPRTYTYGSLTNSQFNVGGDWKYSDVTYYNQTLSNKVSRQSYFGRVSYDVTDDVTVFFNFLHTESYGFARSKLDDQLGNMTIKVDNPYLNESVRAQMTALKLTSFVMGSFLLDIPYITTENWRNLWSYSGGLNGKFDAFDTSWKWDIYGQIGLVRSDLNGHVLDRPNFTRAIDTVRDANNRIVCRSTLTDPTNGCVPFNPFGSGNNDSSAISYVKGTATLQQRNTEKVFTIGLSGGEPFSSWAGPVSISSGFEWREEAVTPGNIAAYCPKCLTSSYTAGNYKGTKGSYSVAEGYVETVIPLAKDTVWARSLDLNGAIRATSYSTSGYVTTWKAGLTYNPIDEIRLRATRSRDIRAPNLGDLYNAGGGGQSPGLVDPFRPGAAPVSYLNSTSGNTLLQPEKADTTGLGVVLQPSFFPGFSTSVDYYDINIKGAIDTIGGAEVLDRCFAGQQAQCEAVRRNPLEAGSPYTVGTIAIIDTKPFNLSSLHQRGLDIEASYATKLDQVVDSWNGDISLRAIGTHIAFYKRDDGKNPVIDSAGTNNGQGPLSWRWMFNANYTLDPFSVTWTGRYMSAGRYGGSASTYVQCSAGSCPVSTASFLTIDYNHVDSVFYQDLSLTYKFMQLGDRGYVQAYLNVSNLMNQKPPMVASTNYWYMTVNPVQYDVIGRRFYAGVRFKM
ncbi:MAG: TonB-dependent receptor domain-containing protein, partial [Rhodospirillaceae bacterium]